MAGNLHECMMYNVHMYLNLGQSVLLKLGDAAKRDVNYQKLGYTKLQYGVVICDAENIRYGTYPKDY